VVRLGGWFDCCVKAYSGSADVDAVVIAVVFAAPRGLVSAGRNRSNPFLGDR
jgi:hypothetical protein